MSDFEELYSLLFTGLVIILFFALVADIVNRFYTSNVMAMSHLELISRALNYSKVVIDEGAGSDYEIDDLEMNKSFSKLYNESGVLPALIIEGGYFHVGRVIAFK
ncbi:Uncharacterised protein [Candidatus Tiddalikarchaeum anstoanum]|nr:Uncharacterised protein [Candidatus Tiddalikarchaeum anstoanum]